MLTDEAFSAKFSDAQRRPPGLMATANHVGQASSLPV
jgi:hypothetical protein